MSGKDRVIDQISRLFAKAEAAKEIGSMEEADAFIRGVHRLLAKHDLTMDDLTQAELDAEEPMGHVMIDPFGPEGGKRNRVAWAESLADIVARANHCRILVFPGSSRVQLVGRKSHREVATYVYARLVRFAKDECEKQHRKLRYDLYWNNGGDMSGAHGFKTSFYRGFNERVRERFAEVRREESRDAVTGQKYALIVVNAGKAVERYMAEEIKPKNVHGVRGQRGHNQSGRAAGRAAGDRADLSGRGLGAGDGPRDSVGRGPKGLLGAG